MPHSIQKLVDLISEMPGIGPRQARRVVQFLLRSNPTYRTDVSEAIVHINEHIKQCVQCFRYDDTSDHSLCRICNDKNRDDHILTVVEKDVDIEGVESIGTYTGRYFVLGALIPLAKQRKSATTPRVDALIKHIREHNAYTEIILAFATTPEGDFTAQELKKALQSEAPGLVVSTLGRGLSLGAEIEYADQETLRSAFTSRG